MIRAEGVRGSGVFLLRGTLENSQGSLSLSSLLNNWDAGGTLCLRAVYVWKYWEYFFPESGILLPTNPCTRSQIPGIVGDRGIYWNPGFLHVVQNHPNHYTIPKSGVFTSRPHVSSVTACCLK